METSTADASWEAYLAAFHRNTPRASTLGHELFADQRGKSSYARFVGILEKSPDPTKIAVLDLGCGDGRLVDHIRLLTGDNARVEALDLVAEEIDRAKAWGRRAQFAVGRAQQLPYADETFNAVLSHFAFSFMRPIEPVVAEIERVLRPQGFFATAQLQRGSAREDLTAILRIFHEELTLSNAEPRPALGDDRRFTPAGIGALFAEAGSTRIMRHEAVPFMATVDADGAWLYLSTMYLFDELDAEAADRVRERVSRLAEGKGGRLRLQFTIDFIAMVAKHVERNPPR